MSRSRTRIIGCVAGAILAIGALTEERALAAPAAATTLSPASLVGRYDGHQMEMAAALELGADGRFQYALSYGALDEVARGSWTLDGGQVLLTSDRVVAPRFVLLAARRRPTSGVSLTLDLPRGMDRQYFKAQVTLADGRTIERQFGQEGLDLPLKAGERAVSVVLTLPLFDLRSDPMPLPDANGAEAHFRFEPHDLGKVGFVREPLRVEEGGLRLERHGRSILFRRVAGE
jgi:hypothetical protein